MSRGDLILKHCESRGFSPPRVISTHYDIPRQSEHHNARPEQLFLSSSSECFLLFRAGERVR